MKKVRRKSASPFYSEGRVDVVFTTLRELVRRDLRKPLNGLPEDAHELVRKYQLEAMNKKFIYSGSEPKGRQEKAFNKFSGINSKMKIFNSKFTHPAVERYSRFENTANDNILVLARRYMSAILGDFTTSEWFENCKLSSGASIGVPYSDTSPERKLTFPISCTHEALDLIRSYFAYDRRLYASIESFNAGSENNSEKYRLVEASRATTVPKTFEIDRMIAIEPTANMYLQLGLMELMYKRLKSFGINVSRQPDRHKYLAKIGSITGNLATIDFSSASDCVSIELLRYLLPKKWFHAVDRIRCSKMELNNSVQELHMISTMGNATTFPLETLVFYCLGCAVIQLARQPGSCLPNLDKRTKIYDLMSVFGDDCIIPTEHAKEFMAVCEYSGFIVNKEKSFFTNKPGFRESCGGDYYRGCDVRPFFIDRPTSLTRAGIESWLYILINKVLKKYISYFGLTNYVYERHALRYLFSVIKECREYPLFVPPDFPLDGGICVHDARIPLCYAVKPQRVTIDPHGTIRFLYKKFVYRTVKKSDDDIRYSLALKRHSYVLKRRRSVWERPIRRKGGFVVAKGASAHWAWPYDHH